MNKMKALTVRKLLVPIVSAIAFSTSTTAVPLTIDFDGAPSGTPANALAPAGVSFENGVFLPDQDAFGDDIPGSDRWQIDTGSPALLAEDPDLYGYGNAPSVPNALNVLFQPALMLFNAPVQVNSFTVTLDNSAFGTGFPLEILFFRSTPVADSLLASIPIDQLIPGFVATLNFQISGVSKVVLPAGAFYDNFSVSLPDAGATGLMLGFAFMAAAAGRRRE
jgi:hypothetical protein